jgi:hypothetical protein
MHSSCGIAACPGRESRSRVMVYFASARCSQPPRARSTAMSHRDFPLRTPNARAQVEFGDRTKQWMGLRARSSGVERYIDTVEVRGSRPLAPTIGNLDAADLRAAFLLHPALDSRDPCTLHLEIAPGLLRAGMFRFRFTAYRTRYESFCW